MKRLFSLASLLFFAIAGIVTVSSSSNLYLWAACFLGLALMFWLAGGPRAYPVHLWILGICWLSVICDVIVADLEGRTITDDPGAYSARAIIYSLCALLVMAAGIRCAKPVAGRLWPGRLQFKNAAAQIADPPIEINRLLISYGAAAALGALLDLVAWRIPGLTQPILAFTLVKYVAVYLLAARVFESQQGYGLLFLVAVFEILTGMVSFFSAYKEAIFVMLIAFASARHRLSIRAVFISIMAIGTVLWISIVWTVVKDEYREIMPNMAIGEKFDYMANRYLDDDIDYQRGLVLLLKRIGYTTLYSRVLASQDAGIITPDYDFYKNAVVHVLTPRLLFPDKAQLNDSDKTTKLLGTDIDEETSIGVGYVAEAQVDFGFPMLLAPLCGVGLLLGLAAEYFMSRASPLSLRQAFMVATLFNCFVFETDIDKSLGGFVTGFLAMAVALKFGYPFVRTWLYGPASRNKVLAARPG